MTKSFAAMCAGDSLQRYVLSANNQQYNTPKIIASTHVFGGNLESWNQEIWKF